MPQESKWSELLSTGLKYVLRIYNAQHMLAILGSITEQGWGVGTF